MQTSYQQTSSRILTRDCVTVGIVFIQVQTVRIGFLGSSVGVRSIRGCFSSKKSHL